MRSFRVQFHENVNNVATQVVDQDVFNLLRRKVLVEQTKQNVVCTTHEQSPKEKDQRIDNGQNEKPIVQLIPPIGFNVFEVHIPQNCIEGHLCDSKAT